MLCAPSMDRDASAWQPPYQRPAPPGVVEVNMRQNEMLNRLRIVARRADGIE